MEITNIYKPPIPKIASLSPSKSILKTCSFQNILDKDLYSFPNNTINSCFDPKFNKKTSLVFSASLLDHQKL